MEKKPWCDTSKPFFIRQRLLHKAADDYARSMIVYRPKEYGPSLERANKAKTEFYRRHEREMLYPDRCQKQQRAKMDE